jgi:hypothetical protein
MNHSQALRLRSFIGKIGAVVCILMFLALLDSCVSRVREPLFTVKLLAGTSEPVEGQLDPKIYDKSQLHVKSSSEQVRLLIHELRTGFWFGGNMWIGEIVADTDALPGSYDIFVYTPMDKPGTPSSAFKTLVYANSEALQRSSLSFRERTFCVKPWMVSLFCVPIIGIIL